MEQQSATLKGITDPKSPAGTRAHYAGKAPDNEFIFRFLSVGERALAESVRRLAGAE